MASLEQAVSRRIGIVAGGGTLPFAVARSLQAQGDMPVLLAIEGYCDPSLVAPWHHHWLNIGKVGRFLELVRAEQCRDVVCVGSLIRPALSEIRLDWQTIRAMPALIAAFRGGDDHLLTGIAGILEKYGINFVGVADVARDLMVPDGTITRRTPDASAQADIAKGRALLLATSAFDIGQAAVVVDGHVVALEDIEGTDALLARVARLRSERKIRAPAGRGVLVKTPKAGQDMRFDLPALGPRTIEGVGKAELAGIAVIAGRTLIAESEAVVTAADQAGLFVTGLPA
jgi:DUF1009 family protein